MRRPAQDAAQSFSVKQAQVEFHNFASLGEPERAFRIYAEENVRRGSILRNHREFIGPMTPFLEIGANAGHTSYMLANEFGADGFALDISADALRHGLVLRDVWGLAKSPVRIAGDALHLPFQDGSLGFVMTCQTLSQFMDIDAVFREVHRVLAPGGVFLFCEEPLRRQLSLRLYRCPYYDTMKPWERKLFDWGLLGYLVKDVIGAHQEESFGIRQNHTMGLREWHALIDRYFAAKEWDVFVPQRGWGEKLMHKLAVRLDRHGSEWLAARMLGGALAGVCRKAGEPPAGEEADFAKFEDLLRCPDCHARLGRDGTDTLVCTSCNYEAPNEGGVYNVIRSAERKDLYPGDREDLIDFSRASHASHLLEGWYELEGDFGNKYRWVGKRASVKLTRVQEGPQRLRIRGHAHELLFQQGQPAEVNVRVNGVQLRRFGLDRTGLFILEADLPDAPEYTIQLDCSPLWNDSIDDRNFTMSFSMIRLVQAD
ncbi:MAG: class I SAM-dependent methyltransferase [Acidobacteriia bacterium]|nr:class I SAM-dependent methyltransferase [Terriglobia bacterium]